MPKDQKTPLPSIDLHGLRKDNAIASVTDFLHTIVRNNPTSSELWVCIITGSGHHSPAGPVLREAIRSLLDKREMQYTVPYGKGSFLVNACSGHELTAAPATATDSKLLVAPAGPQRHDVRLVNRPRNSIMNTTSSSIARSSNIAAAAPKPSEVAADDALVARIKTASAHEHREAQREEHVQLKKALTASKQDLEWELEREAREEEERIAAAVEHSRREEERLKREEEERLEQVLRHSREEEERIKRQEEEKLAAVLKQSQDEEERQRREEAMLLERALSVSEVQVSKQDVELSEVLEQSMHEVAAVDSELNKALSLSLKETVPDEDELLKQALRLSITETTVEMVEEVDYIIEEVD